MNDPLDFEALRREFPVLGRKTYLNSGSYGALARSVKAAFESYLERRLEKGADWDWWVEKSDAVRALMAQLFNAHEDEIAITASASAGINSIASALDFTGSRNKVVTSDFEFPTNGQIWHAQEKRGARVIHVPPAADGYIPLEHFERAIDEHTKIVAVTHVCYRNGAKLDIAGIARLAHAKGALVLVDSYQAAGAEEIDVKALDVDFVVGGMLKYLLGTAGIGYLYARGSLVEDLVPTVSGWFAQRDIGAMNIRVNDPAPSARRFEAGTPAVPNCYAAEAGLRLLLDVGVPNAAARVRALTRRCMERLDEEGFAIDNPREDAKRGPTVMIRARKDSELVDRLAERDIVTSHRDGNVRASFHFYNNEDDIEALIEGLKANRDLIA